MEAASAVAQPRSPATTLPEPLTKRELKVLKLLTTELSPQQIVEEMDVSTATVRSHTKNIYSKLEVHSRFEAIERAKRMQLR